MLDLINSCLRLVLKQLLLQINKVQLLIVSGVVSFFWLLPYLLLHFKGFFAVLLSFLTV